MSQDTEYYQKYRDIIIQFGHFVSLEKKILRQDDELLNNVFHLQPINLLPKS